LWEWRVVMFGQMRQLAQAAVVAAGRLSSPALGTPASLLASKHLPRGPALGTPGLASSAVWASVRGQRGVLEAAARLGGARGYCSAPRVAPRQGPVGWVSLALTCATGGGLLYYYERERSRRLESISGKTGPSVGKAAIGGDFTLQNANQDGKKFSTTELHGKYALIYFGFTMCPDICPDEMEKMAECVDLVAKGGGEVVPVFVTIDPERDTVQRVKEYVKEFHPKMVGLTGSVEACKDAARKYRVYHHRTGAEGDPDYLVDHSIIMYLVDKGGEFITFYGKNLEAKQMADAILEEMKRLGH